MQCGSFSRADLRICGIRLTFIGITRSSLGHAERANVAPTRLIENLKTGHGPEIRPFNLDQVLDQQFLVSEMQKVLYAVESLDQIYEANQQAEEKLA